MSGKKRRWAWRHSATQPTVHGSAQGVGNDCLGDELHIPLRQNQFRAQRLATPAPSRPLCQHCIILTLDHAGNRNTAIFSFSHTTWCMNMKSSWLALEYLRINLSTDKNNIFTKFYDYMILLEVLIFQMKSGSSERFEHQVLVNTSRLISGSVHQKLL